MRIRHRNAITLVLLVMLCGAIVFTMIPQRATSVVVSDSLTHQDVARIQAVLSRERAPLLRGKFAAKDGEEVRRRLRERFGGKLKSITSVDSQYFRAQYSDRWNAEITYEYELKREKDNWMVVGVGYLFERKNPREGENANLTRP